jgi:hypothetical protein
VKGSEDMAASRLCHWIELIGVNPQDYFVGQLPLAYNVSNQLYYTYEHLVEFTKSNYRKKNRLLNYAKDKQSVLAECFYYAAEEANRSVLKYKGELHDGFRLPTFKQYYAEVRKEAGCSNLNWGIYNSLIYD